MNLRILKARIKPCAKGFIWTERETEIYIQPLYVYGYQYTDKTFPALKNIMPLAYHEKEQLEAKLCRDD